MRSAASATPGTEAKGALGAPGDDPFGTSGPFSRQSTEDPEGNPPLVDFDGGESDDDNGLGPPDSEVDGSPCVEVAAELGEVDPIEGPVQQYIIEKNPSSAGEVPAAVLVLKTASHLQAPQGFGITVKNTFLHLEPIDPRRTGLRRARSEPRSSRA